MSQISRRKFLGRSLAATAGSYVALSSSSHLMGRALGANDQIRIGVAGVNGRGNAHVKHFQSLEGVNVVALCEPDQHIPDKRVGEFKKKYGVGDSAIKGHTDVRDMLDRKDVDAIVIATPNHWHSLMTVWACQAGKDVYVEKPVSHAIWEGRKMVEAARKYKRIVQAQVRQGQVGPLLQARRPCHHRQSHHPPAGAQPHRLQPLGRPRPHEPRHAEILPLRLALGLELG